MRKDIEWLKEKLKNMLYENSLSNGFLSLKAQEVIREIIEMVDQLEEPEISENQTWEKIAEYYPLNVTQLKNGFERWFYNEDTKVSKPVIPQFVADWIGECRRQEWSLRDALNPYEEADLRYASKTDNWLDSDERRFETLARAWLDGYEVEKEKLYMVVLSKDNDVQKYAYLDKDGNVRKSTNLMNAGLFKESDIKKIDQRYWLFADEVTE